MLTRPLAPTRPASVSYSYAPVPSGICYYCERPATGMDHVLPVTLAALLPNERWPRELLQLVPCCAQCNSIAGAKLFTTLRAKRHYIRARLLELYTKRLAAAGVCSCSLWRKA